MRIHLPLHPHHFTPQSSQGPLAVIGGDLVVIELQGELEWEGDKADGVVGVLGLDRPDRPTLHIGEHHLLHGKMASLAKPYAVIRKAQAPANTDAHVLEGDAADEESDEEREKEEEELGSAKKRKRDGEEEGDEFTTPTKSNPHPRGIKTPGTSTTGFASSPPQRRDYSSDLSSPPPPDFWGQRPGDEEGEDEEEEREREEQRERERRRRERREARRAEQQRTRYYEVVGVVRKKVVFSLRPEPLVTATRLPE